MNSAEKHQKQNGETTQDPVIIQEKITRRNDEVIIKKYLRGKMLGKGGFASCYEITDLETNRVLAAKIVAKSSLTKKRALEILLSEIKIHKSLFHENIVQLEKVFEDKENVYIILELCPNQTLKELLKRRKRITELECVLYLTQIINALKYLHEKRIVHRDLKLGNLLLGKAFDVKVADFGLAAKMELNGEKRRTICGTPNYIAPEVLDKKQGHSFEVDVWSLGVICYTLLIGRPPFETSDSKLTYRKILKNNYSIPNNVPISEEARDLIKKILVLDPTARPTLNEILQHPFVKNQMNNQMEQQQVIRDNTLHVLQYPIVPSLTDKAIQISKVNTRGDLGVDRSLIETEGLGLSPTSKNQPKSIASFSKPYTGDIKPYLISNTEEPLKVVTQNDEPKILSSSSPKLDVHVTKWIDYSVKYGLGYILSDGTSGVVFNDLTKLILASDHHKLDYIHRKNGQSREILSTYSLNQHPSELQKKVLLLKHFKSYLQQRSDQKNENEAREGASAKARNFIYVKDWLKTQHASMFRLSNKLVQVDFEDRTQILLNSKKQIVYYRNKKKEYSQHPLLTALNLDYPEMVKRLKYTKEILIYFKELKKNAAENHQPLQESNVNDVAFDPYTTRDGVTEKLPEANLYPGMMARVRQSGIKKG